MVVYIECLAHQHMHGMYNTDESYERMDAEACILLLHSRPSRLHHRGVECVKARKEKILPSRLEQQQ